MKKLRITIVALLLACLSFASSYAGTPPVASYSFNEGAGTTVSDSSGNGNNGTIGTAAWSTLGKYGKCLTFAGSSKVTVPDSNSLDLTSAMTLEAWVFPMITPSGYATILLKERVGGLIYSLYAGPNLPNSFITTTIATTDKGVSAPNALPVNVWTFMAATYDGTTLRLFINGAQVSSVTVGQSLVVSSNNLSFGGNSVWGSEFFTGRIDEVRIYNRVLTAAELVTDMATPVGGGTPPPPPDTTPPSAPTGLATTVVSATQINLNWTAATDNVGVVQYLIERMGGGVAAFTQVATSATPSFNDTGLVASTAYSYRVRAKDAALNLGAYSATANATTQAVPPPPPNTFLIAWNPVAINQDGTPCTDLNGYTAYVEALTSPPQAAPSASALKKTVAPTVTGNVDVSSLVLQAAGSTVPYKSVRVWVDAFDLSNNRSVYSSSIDLVVSPPPDTIPPKPVTNIRVQAAP